MNKIIISLGAAMAAVVSATAATPVDHERAEKLARETLAKMTMEEKVSLCGACATMYLNAIPRVGIDREWAFSDCSHTMKPEHQRASWGYVKCDDRATTLPCTSALAATWNPELARLHGDVQGEQMRSRDKSQMLGPAVNLMRNPLSGRNWEYFSEDPFLTAAMAWPLVERTQSHGVVACVKHYCMNSQELARFTQISTVDTRTLFEMYLPGFEACVVKGGALSIMPSYVRLNGIYCSENPFLIKGILRDRWGFKGAIVSDWGGQHSCDNAVLNGGGIECNFGAGVKHLTNFYGADGEDRMPLLTAVREGRVPEATVNEMALNTLYMMARSGFLSGEQDKGERLTEKHHRVAQRIGEEAIVLAKNDRGALPLDRAKTKKLVVFGQIADAKVAHLGSSCESHPEYEISFLDGLREFLGADCEIVTYPLGAEGADKPMQIPLLQLTTYDPNGKDAFIERRWEKRHYRDGKEILLAYPKVAQTYWGPAAPKGSGAKRCVGDIVEWKSSVEIQESGEYDIRFDQGDLTEAQVELDGKTLVDWTKGECKVTVTLEKGKVLPIAFRFRLGPAENRVEFGWIPPSARPAPLATVRAECERADAVLVFTGTTMGFGRAKESEGADRPDMNSSEGHDEAIAEILSWKLPRTVVITRSGSPLEQPWFDACDTYVYTSYLGQEAGRPMARVLFGAVNPSGRMPFTWPKTWADTPIARLGPQTYNTTNCVYLEGLYVGYRWYEKHGLGVQFPFGHGLSYTKFDYGEVKCARTADGNWKLSVAVTNAGSREGAETVQLYVKPLDAQVERPAKELKGFQKLFLKPGETKTAEIVLTKRELAYFDTLSMDFRADPGRYALLVGSSSADIRGQAMLEL